MRKVEMEVQEFDFKEVTTNITLNRKTHKAIIFTTDSKMMKRLDKMYGNEYVARVFTEENKPVAKEYVIDDRMISFRTKLPEAHPLTEEQRKERSKRMKALRMKQLAEKKEGC
jgi:hypothetical protein